MPVRLRITLLFTLVTIVILCLVGSSVYFFSYHARLRAIKTRLTNRSITTGRLFSQTEFFDRRLIEKFDSAMAISLKNISVQVYNEKNDRIYSYSDNYPDTITITPAILDDTRATESVYFTDGKKEAIAYHYVDLNNRMVIISGAWDEEGTNRLIQLKNILFLSLVGGIGISLIGGFLFSRRLLKPIRRITEEVTDISAQNLARRIPTGTVKDEWYNMAQTLNDLLNRLQESFETQRRFISNASHELSTPLTSISSQLEIALQRVRSAADYEKTMKSVLQDVQQMSKLTQTLLEFAKASGNKGGINISLIRIDEVLMAIPANLQKQNNAFEILLDFDPLPENPDNLLVLGNAELLTTAIQNIAVNACKYSSDHKARIRLSMEDNKFLVIIADKGEGIPSSALPNIFEPFYRTDHNRLTPGFGLGLSLAYRFIKLHKGDITVQSKPGEGTIFFISIPTAGSNDF